MIRSISKYFLDRLPDRYNFSDITKIRSSRDKWDQIFYFENYEILLFPFFKHQLINILILLLLLKRKIRLERVKLES